MSTAMIISGNASADMLPPSAIRNPSSGNPQIDKTAQDFESQFLSQMYAQMFDGVGEDSLSGGEESQEVYRSWMVDQYARLTAQAGGIGVAGYVRNELLRLQEMQNAAPAANAGATINNGE